MNKNDYDVRVDINDDILSDVSLVTIGIVRDIIRTRVGRGKADAMAISFQLAKDKVRKWIKMGHVSVLEHFVFSFDISLSRVASHQIVRHRIASYTQETLRVKHDFSTENIIIPPQIDDSDLNEWIHDMLQSFELYKKWLEKGYNRDVVRRFLPSGIRTGLRMTINARSLRNLFEQRLAKVADFEIRNIAERMVGLLFSRGYGFLFEDIPLVKKVINKTKTLTNE